MHVCLCACVHVCCIVLRCVAFHFICVLLCCGVLCCAALRCVVLCACMPSCMHVHTYVRTCVCTHDLLSVNYVDSTNADRVRRGATGRFSECSQVDSYGLFINALNSHGRCSECLQGDTSECVKMRRLASLQPKKDIRDRTWQVCTCRRVGGRAYARVRAYVCT